MRTLYVVGMVWALAACGGTSAGAPDVPDDSAESDSGDAGVDVGGPDDDSAESESDSADGGVEPSGPDVADDSAESESDSADGGVEPSGPDVADDSAESESDSADGGVEPSGPDVADDSAESESDSADGGPEAGDADADADAVGPSDVGPVDVGPADVGPADVVAPGPVEVSETHWRVVFRDEFRGKTGAPSDAYCYDVLPPQCHVWPSGNTHHCDLSDVSGEGFFPPARENMLAAIALYDDGAAAVSLTDEDVRALYGELVADRWEHVDKCTWTSYQLLNWMATDYQGRWSARFDPLQVTVDPAGKGTLRLAATRAPVDAECIHGGQKGGPNCLLHAFEPGEVEPGVDYWVDPDPQWPGVYYAPIGGGCPHGGAFFGVNCQVMAFPPNVLEPSGVDYWVDPDPQWPGVYYEDRPYACRPNIDYEPDLGFRSLTCPILNGGIMSYAFTNRGWEDPDGTVHGRGRLQQHGRFEVKARLPRGQGAFPAAWMMPESGGWPYDGGEIDVVEARDAADEVYQTYHYGRCWLETTGAPIEADGPADCAAKGGVSTHLAKGFTTAEQQSHEFSTRHHLFAVEWREERLDYFVNDVHVGTIEPGSVGAIDEGAPPDLAVFEGSSFPTVPFYWILNHSTWVAPEDVPGWDPQVFEVDYVRSYVPCGEDPDEYCPDGGVFEEGVGCVDGDVVRESPCRPAHRPCVNGGERVGARCLVHAFEPGVLAPGVDYWADADPQWPGVYYAPIDGGCPHGGFGGVNCQVVALAGDVLEQGVAYAVDAEASPPGVYYLPDFAE